MQRVIDPDEQTFAIIYPILREHIEHLLGGYHVFCKYTGQRNPNIGPGTKILFYGSGTGHKIFGEGTVESIEFLSPEDLIKKYGSQLFISATDLEKYRGLRSKDLRLLVLLLSQVKKYDRPLILPKYVTMAGQKMSKEHYSNFITRQT